MAAPASWIAKPCDATSGSRHQGASATLPRTASICAPSRGADAMAASALIVEDHPLFRDALITLVKGALPSVTPVSASSAEEGLRLADSLDEVRLVLVDPGLPGMNGAEAIAAFSRALPEAG